MLFFFSIYFQSTLFTSSLLIPCRFTSTGVFSCRASSASSLWGKEVFRCLSKCSFHNVSTLSPLNCFSPLETLDKDFLGFLLVLLLTWIGDDFRFFESDLPVIKLFSQAKYSWYGELHFSFLFSVVLYSELNICTLFLLQQYFILTLNICITFFQNMLKTNSLKDSHGFFC